MDLVIPYVKIYKAKTDKTERTNVLSTDFNIPFSVIHRASKQTKNQ